MDPDLYLLVARVRAQELQAEAGHHRRPAAWRQRLGWALVETGLRLVSRATPDAPRLTPGHSGT
ncbi:MAG: hypothetical protein HOV96_21000 [Nonomuraea sp.]|nr:hypothetical protein [Nonomuraea sp.]NUP66214.1 hypothetical protein [Nonomuraea sp.]NUP80020.1 hypothetical protein [Nonomuraea sp.]NUS01003.1 hypothetical protein [Nonomuraea sp.]NUT10509.1 hypothetical protein [Nonomuraea sp.]